MPGILPRPLAIKRLLRRREALLKRQEGLQRAIRLPEESPTMRQTETALKKTNQRLAKLGWKEAA